MREATIYIEIKCRLGEEYFAAWDKLTLAQQLVFDKTIPKCGDSGAMGHWCSGCPFCMNFEEEMEE